MPFDQITTRPLAVPSVLPIEADGLVLERGGRRLVDGIDLSIDGSALTVIMGPNGAGKSLLLRLLSGLIDPDAGGVRWAGRAPDRIRTRKLGFVFQKPVLLRRSALANVKFVLRNGMPRSERNERAAAALQRAGLADLAHAPARLLSGGEQQRLAIARALAPEPEILFLDEPCASLDPAATAAIETLVADARLQGTKIVLVTHDIGQARRLADDVVFLHRGRIVEQAPAETFFDAPVSHPARAYLSGQLVI